MISYNGETGLKSARCQGQEAENMEREKFQQKALKQTKQKKSKSAEFLMVKEDREATEGIGNPAFNVSSPDLSACQTAEKKVIRHDMPDRTLAAPQQKFGLPASAEPKGNEYGRNYFDPLMDEEINPRQCAMEVSREVCLMAKGEKAESGVDNTAGLSEKETEKNACASMDEEEAKSTVHSSQGSITNKIGPCSMDYDPNLLKEDLHSQGDSLTDHSVKEKSTVLRTGEAEDYSQDISYLEELEEHRFSVCCSSVADSRSGDFFKHLHFVLVSVSSELQLSQWQSQGFWYIILLMVSLWFLRLYLHYLGQWLFLQAISTPVTKFHFSLYTVELRYPTSSLHIGEEFPVVVMGPLMLNAILLLLVLIRWGCQLLFASCPDVLSKLIITMGLWTVLDPLAVFIVDTLLGRLTDNEETPMADAAKLYWMFVRTMQPGILGVVITVLLYILLFIISSLILHLYCLSCPNQVTPLPLSNFQQLSPYVNYIQNDSAQHPGSSQYHLTFQAHVLVLTHLLSPVHRTLHWPLGLLCTSASQCLSGAPPLPGAPVTLFIPIKIPLKF
ncbi:PREDICTED: uncharacterized protein LOC105572703 [Cercocebus atys]|uniref:uncharacterized protein LOC105572703 n=1 Tax=Cercocebus atys TaxID=9531 RepID=UPI0005F55AAF|nr:PREDICTED: uncharacterized protein LOC105572703 [Cercocebus atys]